MVSAKPLVGRKKTSTPLAACTSVSTVGSVGSSPGFSVAVAVNVVAVPFLTSVSVDVMVLSEAARSGVLVYAKSSTSSLSTSVD